MTLLMTSLLRVFQCLFTFVLVSASHWLAEIWQPNRRGATGELGVEFKFQRGSCKLSFLFPPRRKSAPESLLAGFPFLESADNFSGPKSSFMFALFAFMIKVSINFENDTMKASVRVNEAKWTGLWARNCAIIHKVLITKFAFRPETLPGFSRNGPLVLVIKSQLAICFLI